MTPSSQSHHQQQSIAVGDVLRVLHSSSLPQRVCAVATSRQIVAAVDSSMRRATMKDGVWSVPAEIVGLDSRKSKQAKIKFHPWTLEQSRVDRDLATAVEKAVEDIVDIVTMDGGWRREKEASKKEMASTAAKLRRLFGAMQPLIVVKKDIVLLSWPLHCTPSTSKTAAKAIREAAAFLSGQDKLPLRARVRSSGEEKETTVEEMGGGDAVMEKKKEKSRQMVEMECTLGGVSAQLWRLTVEGGEYLVEEGAEQWKEPEIELTPLCLSLRVGRTILPCEEGVNLPPRLPIRPLTTAVIEENGKENKVMMLDAVQCRVEDLRRRLDESLTAFQAKLSSGRGKKNDSLRQIHLLSTDRTETAIEICEAGARRRLTAPLQVVVADGVSGVAGETGGVIGGVAGSPTESIDSGISNTSPSSSPSAMMSPKASPFYQYSEESSTNAKLAMRSRSLSESAAHSPIQTTPSLRGILKKTPMREYGTPLRGVFKRSLSESADSSPFYVLRSLHSFEDEPLEEVEEEDEEEDDAIEEAQEAMSLQPRKKRVSFSENLVQKRSFRPQCSIVWHQQKMAKKSAKREHRIGGRTMSEGDATSDLYDDDEETKSLGESVEVENGEEQKSASRDTRKDSGFCDEEEEEVIVSEAEEAEEMPLPPPSYGNNNKSVSKPSPFSAAASSRTAPAHKAAAFTIGGPTPARGWLAAASMRGAATHTRTRVVSASN